MKLEKMKDEKKLSGGEKEEKEGMINGNRGLLAEYL